MNHPIERLCLTLGLGQLCNEPEPISGGLLHTMYHVRTSSGGFAVKLLNPDIMIRPDAIQNMINSERIARKLQNTVPLVTAKEFDEGTLIAFEGSYYMIFDWIDGLSIYAPDITAEHCSQIGRILGQIHEANVRIENSLTCVQMPSHYEWSNFLEKADQQDSECFDILQSNLQALTRWSERVSHSWSVVSAHQVISHRDLDPKNVLWANGQPYLIDWESAGFVNPAQELIEIINYWATGSDGEYCLEKIAHILLAYRECNSLSHVNWDAIFDCGFEGMLGWTAYNVRLVLGMEGDGMKDRSKGLREIKKTLDELYRYDNQTKQLQNYISRYL